MTNALKPVATATGVRVRTRKRLVTDRPLAETHERLGGGYFRIEARDLEVAIVMAPRVPGALPGTAEVPSAPEIPGAAGGSVLDGTSGTLGSYGNFKRSKG